MTAGPDGPNRAHWNAVYKHLIDNGFSPKPMMENAGIYVENPFRHSHTSRTQPLNNLAPLAKAGVPILHVCGSLDPRLESNTRVAQKRYTDLGGKITVIVREGEGHFMTLNPQPVVEFITANVHVESMP